MSTISVAEVEGQWSALIDRVEAGETVSLTRLGKEVARLTPAERPKIRIDAEDLRVLTDKRLTSASMAFSPSDIEELRALTESMPISDEDGGEFIREDARRRAILMFYVDTSVLVLALTPEAATGRVLAWLGLHPAGGLLTSDWVVTEFSAALSIKLRTGAIDAGYRARTLAQFQRISMTKFATISITPATFRTAARFADQYASGLRAGDALHLALAADQAATIATLDTRLVVAAKALGIASMPL